MFDRREYDKRRFQDPEKKAKHLASVRAWQEKNKELVYANNKRWQERNPERWAEIQLRNRRKPERVAKKKEYDAKRRAKKKLEE
jgi:hypothetical protein